MSDRLSLWPGARRADGFEVVVDDAKADLEARGFLDDPVGLERLSIAWALGEFHTLGWSAHRRAFGPLERVRHARDLWRLFEAAGLVEHDAAPTWCVQFERGGRWTALEDCEPGDLTGRRRL